MLAVGMKKEEMMTVQKEDVVSHFKSGGDGVLATPILINWMEQVCLRSALPELLDGENTVGTKVMISHLAPTPIGQKVTIKVTLAEVSKSGKKLLYDVEAFDEADKILVGQHERAVINESNFLSMVDEKASGGRD